MNSIDFPQANITLGAGNNPNTQPLRVAICNNSGMPKYKAGFLVSKWEMEEGEKKTFKTHLLTFLTNDQVDKVLESIPPVFLSHMHSMSPVMVLAYPADIIFSKEFLVPDQAAADKVNNKRFEDN